ncbi:hypothetical protein L1887_06934 [Cichorium endivia]|nr:hypothetical protein L1887_06934 [Cichorium endivia]
MERWKDWFRSLIRADQQEIQYVRTAWLKILGLPLKLWDETNFSKIAERFGKVINPFNEISSRSDFSMGKVGVLTSKRTWINEDIKVLAGGTEYTVGIVEYTDDWSPFYPLPFDKVEEDDDSEDGISDTWAENNENNDREEGEIRPENTPVEAKKMAVDGSSPTVVGGNINSRRLENDVEENNEVGQPTTSFGPLQQLVPSGCFGPFPNDQRACDNETTHLNPPPPLSHPMNEADESHFKKRKRDVFDPPPELCTQLFMDPPIANNENEEDSTHSLNLNEAPSRAEDSENSSSQSDELRKIVKIGAEIGIHMEVDNPILAQVISEAGEPALIP